MSFSSIGFIIFFTIVLAVLLLLGVFSGERIRQTKHRFLLLASYIFYGWWDWHFCFLMLLLTVVAYISARQMNGKYRRLSLAVGVIVPQVILGFFKFLGFFMESISALTGMVCLCSLNIILPVGISFYTFQSMSYTIDVYRGKLDACGALEVSLYISFFPQLVAGPIVKAQDFIPQLKEDKRVSLKNLECGLQIFVFGLFKKIVLADRLSVFVDDVFATPAAFSSLTIALGCLSYALQIYFDFSGYSDMAIGCAHCMGYQLNRNFNLPYLSKNPTEFWKRWHISLSTWLQEYLYIPLGGNRKGKSRTYINLIITMLLGGLWHGASWTFVVWGALHGLALCAHKLYAGSIGKRIHIPAPLAVITNTVFVSVCWVFFRAEDFETAITVINKLVVWSDGVSQIYMWLIFALIVEAIYLIRCRRRATNYIEAYYPQLDLNTIPGLTLFFFGVMMTIGLAYTGTSPFIYFQF